MNAIGIVSCVKNLALLSLAFIINGLHVKNLALLSLVFIINGGRVVLVLRT